MGAGEGGRRERRDVLVGLLQDYATEIGRLRHAFAERQGLHITDLQALLAVLRAERRGAPLTPGRLGEHLGLSSGATTAVIDRLERLGHVQRSREETDRRRVTLRYGGEAAKLAREFFAPLGEQMDDMLAGWSETDLDVVCRFLTEMTALIARRRAEVGDGP